MSAMICTEWADPSIATLIADVCGKPLRKKGPICRFRRIEESPEHAMAEGNELPAPLGDLSFRREPPGTGRIKIEFAERPNLRSAICVGRNRKTPTIGPAFGLLRNFPQCAPRRTAVGSLGRKTVST